MGATEWTVVVLVVGARLILPFTIPYFPLVGVIACLILDSADQSIFQQFPAIPLEGYQSYDKSLDIYYLAIAYLATLRNWSNPTAFKMSWFLYYYRLVGVVAFELTQVRAILFIFPNTFEYFFIFYEGVRLRWNTARMGVWTVVIATVLIWVFIKLPQEWWIHIAQLDMTDFIKETLFGVSAASSWSAAIANRPWVLVAAAVAVAALLGVCWWIITRKAPPGDHGPGLRADPLPAECRGAELYRTARLSERVFDWALLEKVVLLGLISVIFAQILVGTEVRTFAVIAFVALFLAINAIVSHGLARRGRSWKSVATEAGTMGVINLIIVLTLDFMERVLGIIHVRPSLGTTLFFVFLFTVITVLYDRYRTVFTARRMLERAAVSHAEPPAALQE